jgi:mitochondrial fission protein ELM1
VLAEARASAEARFADYPGIRIGLVLGGTTRGVAWDDETCERFADRLKQIPLKGHVVLAIASRRTPPQLQSAVKEALKNHRLFFWNGEDGSENPYRQILALSDRLVVTGDSHNMVSEALAPGVPTYVFRPHGLKPKLHQFLDDLQDHRMVQNFEGAVETFPSWPIDSTGEIADAIRVALEG